MSGPAPQASVNPSSRTAYKAGRDLQPGNYVRLIADGGGNVVDGETYLLATDQVDRKGNRLLVNTGTGVGVYATPSSIWTV